MEQRFFQELKEANTILLAGAGGGFDIYAGLPLYFMLRQMGKKVHLANLSFSTIYASTGRRIGPAMVEVNSKTESYERYFPELHLVHWLKRQGDDTSIYCFDRTGAKPIREGYAFLAEHLQFDTVILVDGGTDSLMRGDEVGLGTPAEDIASIAAVDVLPIARKMLACIGFGIDTFHGVCHAHFLEAVAEITERGGFLGAWSLTQEMPEAQFYKKASEYTLSRMFNHPSIVNNSILSALEGRFGDYHATYRTAGSELFINPLMTLYWAFQLDTVVARNLYIDCIRETEQSSDIRLKIEEFRLSLEETKPWTKLPM